MGKPTGFVEWPRRTAPKRAKAERLHDWKEFVETRANDESRQQAGRCMDCGVPFCHQGCPLGNQIPDWNDLVYKDRWRAAFENLASTNNFPEFTGRLCPAPCEASCVLAIDQDPVTIEQVEKDIVERAFAEGWIQARPPARRTGRKVAVVGSGPAGLAAAAQLNLAGHSVIVYESADRLGGLLRYGIPDFKLEKHVIDRRLALLEAEGVEFVTNANVGVAPTWNELKDTHDAVIIATGARRARDLSVPGRELPGVVFAMDFLEHQNRVVDGRESRKPALDAAGKRVVILGGGDTGSDCLGTSLRQGASEVRQIELLPAPPGLRDHANPWPQWPLVFRTSSSQEEGGARGFATMTTALDAKDGVLAALRTLSVEEKKDAAGRTTLVPVAGSESTIAADLLVLALGFTGPQTETVSQQLGVALDARGNIATDADFATKVPGVYAIGDAKRGASLIVWAIAEGREVAAVVDARLQGQASALPRKGAEKPFGGR